MLRRKFIVTFLSAIAAMGAVAAIPQSAQAAQSCTLSFNAMGGVSVPAKTSVCGVKITAPSTTKVGARFLGWDTSSTASSVHWSAGSLVPNNDQVLYAVWQYTVSFNANGHGVAPGSIQVPNGNVTPVPSMTSSGYTFKGWCVGQAVCSSPVIRLMVTGNVTLYAKW